jgi:hypothetical protein
METRDRRIEAEATLQVLKAKLMSGESDGTQVHAVRERERERERERKRERERERERERDDQLTLLTLDQLTLLTLDQLTLLTVLRLFPLST